MANPSENTPLLGALEPSTDTSNIEGPATLSPTAPVLARDHFKRPIRILTKLILITSSIAIILAIINAIVLETAPFESGRHFGIPQVILLLGFFTFLALILSIVNLRHVFPILLNIIADAGLAIYLAGWTMNGYELSYYGFCYSPAQPRCEGWVLTLKILVGVLVGCTGLVGVAHLILFVLRVIACFKVSFWERPFGLWFPTGELTVAVTIKVLRQQPPVERAVGEGALVQVVNE